MWSLLVFAGMVAAGPQSLVGTAVNVSISDMSPMLAYAPSASGPADIAWNQTYSNTSWSVYTPQYPVSFDGGDSAHTTSFSGASVAHEFIGTAVYFYGSASGTLTLNIDGTEQKVDVEMPSHGLLASSTGLANGRHSAVLALSGGTLSVQNVTVELQVGGDGATLRNVSFDSYQENDTYYAFNPNINYSGQGSTYKESDWQIEQSVCGHYNDSTSSNDASAVLHPPANTSMIYLWGPSGPTEGSYTVTIDPPLFDGTRTRSFTQENPWLAEKDAMAFFAPLDYRKNYTITIQYTGPETERFDLSYGKFLITSGGAYESLDSSNSTGGSNGTTSGTNNPSPKKSAPIGAIVGGVVGGVVLLLAIGLLIFFCLKRKKTSHRRDGKGTSLAPRRNGKRDSAFEIDGDEATVYRDDGSYHSQIPLTPAEAAVTPLFITPSQSHVSPAQAKAQEAGARRSPVVEAPNFAGPAGYDPATAVSPTSPTWAATSTNMYSQSNSHSHHYSDGPLSATSPSGASAATVGTFGPRHAYPPSTAEPLSPHDEVTEEVDAGRIPQPQVKQSVPPRYNPAWAEEDEPRVL